jgi:hypothetical protein
MSWLAGCGDDLPGGGREGRASGSAGLRREMMRTLWKWALVLAIPAGWVAAQQPDEAIPDETTVQLLLLRQKSVQKELQLGPDFAKKITDFTNKEADAYLDALKLKDAESKKKIEELEQTNKKFIEDHLNAAQRKRLEQIGMQVTGLQQLTRPEGAKALDLTEQQQTKFRELYKEARKQLEDIIMSKEGRNEKLAKLRKEVDSKIGAVLTDAQKKKAREIVGEPFTGELLFEEWDVKEVPGKKLNPPGRR